MYIRNTPNEKHKLDQVSMNKQRKGIKGTEEKILCRVSLSLSQQS